MSDIHLAPIALSLFSGLFRKLQFVCFVSFCSLRIHRHIEKEIMLIVFNAPAHFLKFFFRFPRSAFVFLYCCMRSLAPSSLWRVRDYCFRCVYTNHSPTMYEIDPLHPYVCDVAYVTLQIVNHFHFLSSLLWWPYLCKQSCSCICGVSRSTFNHIRVVITPSSLLIDFFVTKLRTAMSNLFVSTAGSYCCRL